MLHILVHELLGNKWISAYFFRFSFVAKLQLIEQSSYLPLSFKNKFIVRTPHLIKMALLKEDKGLYRDLLFRPPRAQVLQIYNALDLIGLP